MEEGGACSTAPDGALTTDEFKFITKLINTNMHGYASARLSKLKPHVLDALVEVCSSPRDNPVENTVQAKVKRVLQAKEELKRETEKRCETPAPPSPSTPPERAPSPPPPPKLVKNPTPPAGAIKPVFKVAHSLSILAFNTLKLRLDGEKGVREQWSAAIEAFAKYDVLMLSEVRAGDKLFKERALKLIDMLNACGDGEWEMKCSEPSNGEVHVVLAKQPVMIVSFKTLNELDGLTMDYSPLVVCLEDCRFVGELRRVCVTSVHFPPNSTKRRPARDAQIRKLAACYAAHADTRLGNPFSNKAAKETKKPTPYVAHVIGGDFNASATELRSLGVEQQGWQIVLGDVRTSSGCQAYDNFLVNLDCKDHVVIGADVLDLNQYANFRRGEQGISDHAPISLRIKEVPRVRKPRPRAAVPAASAEKLW